MFEWDERKRASNLAKHEIDFVDAVSIFDGPVLEVADDRRDYGEQRIIALGRTSAGRFSVVIYTWRGGATLGRRRRIISARKAGADEIEDYHRAQADTR